MIWEKDTKPDEHRKSLANGLDACFVNLSHGSGDDAAQPGRWGVLLADVRNVLFVLAQAFEQIQVRSQIE